MGATNGCEPDDDRSDAAKAAEHLQAAARELIAASRSFLDVAEELVEDRRAFDEAADVIREFVSRVGAGAEQRGRRGSRGAETGCCPHCGSDQGPASTLDTDTPGADTPGADTPEGFGTSNADDVIVVGGRSGSSGSGRSRARGDRVRRIDVE